MGVVLFAFWPGAERPHNLIKRHSVPEIGLKVKKNRLFALLTGTFSGDIMFFDFEKGLEKDTVRRRHQREAAMGCKQLLPEPETVTALEPPTDM